MTWNDLSPTDVPEASAPAPAAPAPPPDRTVGSPRRGLITALLAGGLLILGGTAVVNAADPSTSPAPSASQGVDDGSSDPAATDDANGADGARGSHDCPEDGTTDDGTTDSGVDGSST